MTPSVPLTLEEHRALNLTRPLTDDAIGACTQARRTMSAELSALVTEMLGFVPDARAERLPEAPVRRRKPRKVPQ